MTIKKFIVISSDHNGVILKNKIQKKFASKYNFVDIGPTEHKEKVDYTDYSYQLANIISKKQVNVGILVCGTGIGMSIVANKLSNVRAAIVHNKLSALNSRDHNDSNVICLGSWINSDKENLKLVHLWLNTKFGHGRHTIRVEKINKNKNLKKIIFTNGVFDILHTGHVELLKYAKSLGKKLIVGINTDRTVKILKGKNRPINNEEDRKKILLQLNSVDEVIVYDDLNTSKLIKKINPDIIVKGSEFSEEFIRKNDKISKSIKIKTFNIKKGYSTTSTLKKIKKLKSV